MNARAELPRVFWLTGLSGAGKTTIAEELAESLRDEGKTVVIMDGDILRGGLNSDLSFTKKDRKENLRRVREVARFLHNVGLHVIVSLITPYEKDRAAARELLGEAYFEVFVDTPLAVCMAADVKGLYAKAISGEIPNFTGISSTFEQPTDADIVIQRHEYTAKQAADKILQESRAV